MKNLMIILIAILITSISSCKKNEIDLETDGITLENYTIQQMSFINANEGWMFVSVNGENNVYKMIHSSDGFENYTVVNEDCPRFRKLEFIDSNVGIGISWDGTNTTYYTNDGGATWKNFVIPENDMEGSKSYDITYNDTYFAMPYHKEKANYLMSIGVRFFNRSDFQFHHKVLFDSEDAGLYGGSSGSDQHFSSAQLFASGEMCFTGVYKQEDAIYDVDKSFTAFVTNETSITVHELANEKKSPERTEFTTLGVGYYTLKDDANLYKTGDRGNSWSSVYTFDDATSYKQISFADNKNGAVLCGSKLYLTNDGGESFHQSPSIDNTNNMVEEVVYIDTDNIFLSVIDVTDGISQQKLLKIKD